MLDLLGITTLRRFDREGEGEGVDKQLAGSGRAGALENPSAATGEGLATEASGEDLAEAGTPAASAEEASAEAALAETAERSP